MLTSRLTHCDYNQKASQGPVVKEVRQHGFLHLVDIETPPPLYLTRLPTDSRGCLGSEAIPNPTIQDA